MMEKQIIKRNEQLFLFQVLDHGCSIGAIPDTFLEKIHTQGTQMSYAFAKRYYSVVYNAYLRQASHCVLGITNLGLIEDSKNQMQDAIPLLLKKNFVGLFREGWTRVLNLVHYAQKMETLDDKTSYEWEKDFAESFSAEPGKPWVGYNEYLVSRIIYRTDKSSGQNG